MSAEGARERACNSAYVRAGRLLIWKRVLTLNAAALIQNSKRFAAFFYTLYPCVLVPWN